LRLKCDELLSRFAFKFNLRRYNEGADEPDLYMKGRDRGEPVCRPVKPKQHSYEMPTRPGAHGGCPPGCPRGCPLSAYHSTSLEAGGSLRTSKHSTDVESELRVRAYV
jgi:hypothetical protein